MTVVCNVSLDGVMQAPGLPDEDRRGGFEYGGWGTPYSGDAMGRVLGSRAGTEGGMLLGRRTYEGFAAAWPSMADDAGFADKMNSMPKYVVSSTLRDAEWNNSTILSGDLADKVSKLKQEVDGVILVAGSAQLVQGLIEHDLVDELRLMVFPVVLGKGKRLFGETSGKKPLRLADSKTVGDGIALLTYERAGS
jgi:dihydrofolate reductase